MNRNNVSLTLSSVVLLAAISCSSSEAEEVLVFEPGHFVSADRCGTCHTDIFAAWKTSLHARSFRNKIFKASYEEALQVSKDEAQAVCLPCHAPAALLTQDAELTREVSREGVTCDFCHSLVNTHLSGPEPFEVRQGRVKFGPVENASSHAHGVEFSPFHTTSLHCAGCHQYTNRQGLEVLSTYSEWESYQEKGGNKSCQECHMPIVTGNIVDPKVKRVEGALVNLHDMPGGHSLHQLNRSLRMRITGLERTAKGLRIKVRVSNVGAGHYVPTGGPLRKVVLKTEAQAGDLQFREERVYQRRVLDQEGQEIRRDSLLFLQGTSIANDTRIAPFEERNEEFFLPVPYQGNVVVTASLTYAYSPHDRKETETLIEFAKEKKELLNEWEMTSK